MNVTPIILKFLPTADTFDFPIDVSSLLSLPPFYSLVVYGTSGLIAEIIASGCQIYSYCFLTKHLTSNKKSLTEAGKVRI